MIHSWLKQNGIEQFNKSRKHNSRDPNAIQTRPFKLKKCMQIGEERESSHVKP